MSNFQSYALLVGSLLPVIIAVVQQQRWPDYVRAGVGLVICAVAAAVTAYAQGDLTAERWGEGLLLVAVAAWSSYQGFWKPTGIAPTVEAKTSMGTSPP